MKTPIILKQLTLILTIGLVLTYVPSVVFPGWRYNKYIGVIVLLFVLIIINYKKTKITNTKTQSILFLYTGILLTDIFVLLLNNNLETTIRSAVLILLYILFYIFLTNYSRTEKELIGKLITPYLFFSIFIIFTGITVYILSWTEIVNYETYLIPENYGYEYTKEVDISSEQLITEDYLVTPLFLTILSTFSRLPGVLPFVLNGMSYEPHVACFFILPSYFLIDHLKINNTGRTIIKFGYYSFLLLSLSVSGILIFSFVNLIRLFHTNFFKGIASFIFIVISLSFLLKLTELGRVISGFLNYKLFESKSKDVSANYLKNILDPNEVIGDGFLVVPESGIFNAEGNGLYETLIFLILYGYITHTLLRLYRIKSKYSKMVFWTLLYLTIHSFKIPYHIINYPFVFFLVFIAVLITKQNHEFNSHKTTNC